MPIRGRLVNLGPDGISDIVLILPPHGRLVGFEVKSERGAQRPVQKAFQARLEAAGGYYAVVRSVSDVQGILLSLDPKYLYNAGHCAGESI